MGYQVEIDQDSCVSAGKCVATLPGLFAFDEHELAVVRPEGAAADDATLLRVARQCPSGAIRLLADGVTVEL